MAAGGLNLLFLFAVATIGLRKSDATETQRDKLGQWPQGDDNGISIAPNLVRGLDYLKIGRYNKGMAFTLEERQTLGIHGLLPPRIKTQEEQLNMCQLAINSYEDKLHKYIYLMDLQDRNERLFYRFLGENVVQLMPIVYTPTVGDACQKYGLIYRRPRGLFISIYDKNHIYEILKNWPETDVRAIVVTDGERILGLGDLGAYGMGIPVGKLALYTALGGIKPHQCLPITLDVGTNNDKLLADPNYIGLKIKRYRGKEYDDFIDEFMKAVVKRFGQSVLIQFEDFANQNALRLLQKYRNDYCTFNDDIQGTAAVALAGLLSAFKMEGVKKKLSEHKILFVGAGSAALGIAELLVKAMERDKISETEARSKIWMVNSKGLIVFKAERGEKEKLHPGVEKYEHKHREIKELADIIDDLQPTILIGASSVGGAFTKEALNGIVKYQNRPIIFALSNPTSQSECTAEEAYTETDGKAIFASGSPFNPVTHNGQTFEPGQANNAYIFPGVALGIITAGMHHVDEDVFLDAAEALSNQVTPEDFKVGRIFPDLRNIKESSIKIAIDIVKKAFKKGGVSTYPEPKDIEKFVRDQLYNYNYIPSLPSYYTWPNL